MDGTDLHGSRVVYRGGNANNGSNDGMAYANVNNGLTNANVNISGRLSAQYLVKYLNAIQVSLMIGKSCFSNPSFIQMAINRIKTHCTFGKFLN